MTIANGSRGQSAQGAFIKSAQGAFGFSVAGFRFVMQLDDLVSIARFYFYDDPSGSLGSGIDILEVDTDITTEMFLFTASLVTLTAPWIADACNVFDPLPGTYYLVGFSVAVLQGATQAVPSEARTYESVGLGRGLLSTLSFNGATQCTGTSGDLYVEGFWPPA